MARTGVEVTEAEMPAMEAAELQVEAPKAEGATEKALDPESTPTGEMMMMAAPTEEVQDLQAEPPAALTMPSGGGQPAEEFATADAELSLPTETPLPTVEPTPAPVEELAPPAPPARPYWRAAEILLALIAISSGLVALYLRRSAAG
jgi:hypothetical protein